MKLKNKFFVRIFFVVFYFLSLPLWGQNQKGFNPANGSTGAPAPIKGMSTEDLIKNNPNTSAQTQGKKADSTAKIGAVAGVAAAAFCVYQAIQCGPVSVCTALWAGGALLASGVAIKMLKEKKKGSDTANAVSVSSPTLGLSNDRIESSNDRIESTPEYQAIAKMQNDLAKKGVKMDLKKGTVTMPDGKSYTAEQFSSAQGMKSTGFSKDQIKQFSDNMKNASQAALKTTDVQDGVMGGGPSGKALAMVLPQWNLDLPAEEKEKLAIDRDPAQVAGMSKMYNGEPIGVAQDSIFKMMNRRINLKGQQANFIEQ